MRSMIDPRTPVLIGAGQRTYRRGPPPGPVAMLEEAALAAVSDAGLEPEALRDADLVGVVGFTIDAGGDLARLPAPRVPNPPGELAARLGAGPRRALYTHAGGNNPQALVNWAAERIAASEHHLALLCGAEFLGSLMKALKSGGDLSLYGGEEREAPE
ncbi:MAG: acetyl-CoA acetyltransferase, partial [Hyphomonadaceae bacterium]